MKSEELKSPKKLTKQDKILLKAAELYREVYAIMLMKNHSQVFLAQATRSGLIK